MSLQLWHDVLDLLGEPGMIHFIKFATDDGLAVQRSIDGENPVQMVDLMLQQFGSGLLNVRPFAASTIVVHIPHGNGSMPSQPYHDPGEAHAVVPHRECLRTPPCDNRISDDERSIQMKSDEAQRHADLRRGNRTSESMPRSRFFKRTLKTMLVGNVCGVRKAGHGFRDAAKTRIAQQQNVRIGHHDPPFIKRESWASARWRTETAIFDPVSISSTLCP